MALNLSIVYRAVSHIDNAYDMPDVFNPDLDIRKTFVRKHIHLSLTRTSRTLPSTGIC
jgi:hypothetical protein